MSRWATRALLLVREHAEGWFGLWTFLAAGKIHMGRRSLRKDE